MLNVNQITSDLARLPDQALQRYAMMHKDDPYIVSLALSESNRRKELRAGAQGQQQQQPPVVDQAVAEMAPQHQMTQQMQQLPEEVGIGALPAQNVAHMAEGGIVGYGDQYSNEDLVYSNEPAIRMADGGMVAFADNPDQPVSVDMPSTDSEVNRILSKSPYERTSQENATLERAGYKLQRRELPQDSAISRLSTLLGGVGSNLRSALTSGTSSLSNEELARLPAAGGALNERILRSLGMSPATTNLIPEVADPAVSGVYPDESRRGAAVNLPVAATSAPAINPERRIAPITDQVQRAAIVRSGAGIPSLMTSPEAIQREIQKLDANANLQIPEQYRSALEAYSAADIDARQKAVEELKAEQAARQPAFKDLEARLKAREERLAGQERDNTSMALLQAGLAIMGGTSPYALANIGAGAQVGVKAFAEGADRIERARDKLDESFAKIEEIRRNESRMDAKELREANKDARQGIVESKKLFVSAYKDAWGVSQKQASDAFSQAMQNKRVEIEQAGMNARTNAQIKAQLSTPERQIWDDLLAKNKGDTAAAYQELTKLKSEKFNVAQSYADYLRAFAGKETMEPPLSFAKYAAQFTAPAGPPKIGDVVQGYAFKGGDPSDKTNWEKVK